MERRTAVRLLVGLGIGIPVAIEGATFLGLVRQQVGGDGGDSNGSATPEPRSAGVGDDLLTTTPQVERVERLVVEAGDERTFVLSVAVENTGEVPYQLRLGPVGLDDGTQVSGSRSTERIAAGESETLRATWTVPSGATPTAVTAVGVTDPGGRSQVVRESVRLGKVPIQRS